MSNPEIKYEDLTRKDKVYLGLLRLCSRLPLGFLQGVGKLVGLMASKMPNSKPFLVVKRNLELCFPEKSAEDILRLTRANLMATAPSAFEFAKTWGMPTNYSLSQIKKVHNEALFLEAINSGRGTLAIIPHFGSWEFMNAWTNSHTSTTLMYKPGKDKGVDLFVLEARGRLNADMVPADERGVKASLKALKKGSFCGILPDHVPHDNGGIFAPFFGISTWTGVLVPRLVQRTQCATIMMSCIRRPNADGYEIFIDPVDPEIYSDDLLTSTTAMNRTIETLLRRSPEHYHWFYKRFKKNETLPHAYRNLK